MSIADFYEKCDLNTKLRVQNFNPITFSTGFGQVSLLSLEKINFSKIQSSVNSSIAQSFSNSFRDLYYPTSQSEKVSSFFKSSIDNQISPVIDRRKLAVFSMFR